VELFFHSPICLHGVQRDNFTFLYLSVARDERFIWNTARTLYIYIYIYVYIYIDR
jgi:hypothetical protein